MRFLLLFLCTFSFSCATKQGEKEAAVHSRDSIAPDIHLSSVSIDSPERTAPQISPDTTIQTLKELPSVPVVPTPPQGISILFAGTYHADEVHEHAAEWPWLGLFNDDLGNFELRKTNVLAQRVADGLLDDPASGEKTGWEISTERDEYPTMLLSGGDFTEGSVDTGEVPSTLLPGDSVQVAFKDIHYLLYATGFLQTDQVSGVHYVSDYRLYVVQTEKGKIRKTLLANHASFDDAMTSVLWSGDLDRDGYLDFLIDMSRHYNQSLPTLFLSRPAGEDKVVVPVAEHSSVGC